MPSLFYWLRAAFLILSCEVTVSCHGSGSASGSPGGANTPGWPSDTLPACAAGGPTLTALPVDLSAVQGFTPLGHLAPPPHTFPSDHMYFYALPGRVIDIFSPGEVTVVDVAAGQVISTPGMAMDYAIYVQPCREVELYFYHVKVLAPGFAAKLGDLEGGQCMTYTTGGATYHRCDKNVDFTLAPGEPIGSGGLDFGAMDGRLPASYLDLSHYNTRPGYPDNSHVACPVDYFTPELQAQLKGTIGNFLGKNRGLADPYCGTVSQDVAGTAQGRWFLAGTTGVATSEDPHVALVHDYDWITTRQVFSVGTSVVDTGLGTGTYFFAPQSSGTHNRDFGQVTSDGQVYCYDGFQSIDGSYGAETTILLQLPTPTTMRIARGAAGLCPPVAVMDARATDFER